MIAKAYWGRGFATEAAHAVVDFGFREAGLSRIIAVTMPQNKTSRRVLEKLGFTYQGKRHLYQRRVSCYLLEREQVL